MIDTHAPGLFDSSEESYFAGFVDEVTNELDDLDMSSMIAFTWTPDPQKYVSSEPRKQYKTLLDYILLSAYKYFRLFVFVPEMNANGNVHIHGFYVVKDKIAYLKQFLPKCKQLGFTLCKTKVDIKWFEYCKKDIEVTIGVIGDDLPIPLTQNNVHAYKQIWKRPKIQRVPHKYNMKKITEYFSMKK